MPASANDDLFTFFDDLAVRWDAMQSAERGAHLARVLAPHAALFAGVRRVLDVGAGTGAFLPQLRRLAPDARILAIDLSAAMLARAQASGRGDERVAWLRADAHALPLRSGQMALVTCHDSFAHFEDRPRALAAFRRALAPGGHLLILHDISREKLNAIHGGAAAPRVRSHTLPPVGDLAALVAAVGFTVLDAIDAPDHYLVTARRA
jgi:demethylmenaquinone methyltransferase/2-methoxy-6-polyprenyl-1,4-benzoquinol methylase